jgi:hypothetical protein
MIGTTTSLQALYETYRNAPTRENRDALIIDAMPLAEDRAIRIGKRLKQRRDKINDLIGEAHCTLVKMIDDLKDRETVANIRAYISTALRREIHRAAGLTRDSESAAPPSKDSPGVVAKLRVDRDGVAGGIIRAAGKTQWPFDIGNCTIHCNDLRRGLHVRFDVCGESAVNVRRDIPDELNDPIALEEAVAPNNNEMLLLWEEIIACCCDEDDLEIVDRRDLGETYEEIAAAMKRSHGWVHGRVKAIEARLSERKSNRQ